MTSFRSICAVSFNSGKSFKLPPARIYSLVVSFFLFKRCCAAAGDAYAHENDFPQTILIQKALRGVRQFFLCVIGATTGTGTELAAGAWPFESRHYAPWHPFYFWRKTRNGFYEVTSISSKSDASPHWPNFLNPIIPKQELHNFGATKRRPETCFFARRKSQASWKGTDFFQCIQNQTENKWIH